MTKKFINYLLQILWSVVALSSIYKICGLFETLPHANLAQFAEIRVGIWIFGIVAAIWFVWRGYNGFYRRMDFWIDENNHRW